MKILITLGFIIVFLSAFFIFFVFGFVGKHYLQCTGPEQTPSCSLLPQTPFLFAIALISLFIIIIVATSYIIIRNVKEYEDL